ncbi:hypothetical protein [Pseudomonas sp. VB3]|uniref:hypothetical protein n=1 Tax=Pseudomonas sp. VB3 TaxID=2994641 RepID=UPI0022EC56F9|nr:hypothetical protein [Pseudomonas sp. VB3]
MKTALGIGLVLVLVVTTFTALGLSENNHMLVFGLLLAVISGLVTIALAATAKIQALRATFEPAPLVAQNKSHSFSNTTAMHHYPSEELRELASLRQDLRTLQDLHGNAVFEIAALKTHMRLCFDNIRYHEQITLPHALAGQAGAFIVATLMTLVGTALCALPDIAYALAKAVNLLLVNGWQHASHWRAG